MDPVTIGLISAGIATIGVAGETLSKYQAVKEQASAYKSAEGAAKVEAESARQSAAYEETQYRRKEGLLAAKGTAEAAASGLSTTSGSPLFSDIDNARQIELGALNIRAGGERAAASKEYEARIARFQRGVAEGQVPGIIIGGVAKEGSVLSNWMSSYNKSKGGGGMN